MPERSVSAGGGPLAGPSKTTRAKRKIKDEDVASPGLASPGRNSIKKIKVEIKTTEITIDLTRHEAELDTKPVVIKNENPPTTPKNKSKNRGTVYQTLTPNTASTGSPSSSINSSQPNAVARAGARRTPAQTRRATPIRRPHYGIFQGDFNEPELDFFIGPDDEWDESNFFGSMRPPTPSYSWRRPAVRLGRLGLLNGRYSLESPLASLKWPDRKSNFSLIFTIIGSALWGRFNLGGVRGVFRIPDRPKYSSHQAFDFKWRGESDERGGTYTRKCDGGEEKGCVLTGDNHHGHVKFLGDGRIEGMFSFLSLIFSGQRLDGQGTRSEISAWEMEAEWGKYAGGE